MKTAIVITVALALAGGASSLSTTASAGDVEYTSTQLTGHAMYRRAVEAAIWGMPAVNFQRMLDAANANGASANQVIYWSRPVNSKNQTLTPNPDTIYLNPFYDTTAGPVVLEIPPAEGDFSITGSVDDAWQNPLEDVGPAGADQGRGGKYLITPPGYKEPAPQGYIVLPSDTYRGFVILRSNFKSGSDADIAAAVEYGKRIKCYPLGRSAGDTVYVDLYDKPFDATIPYDARFFDALDRFVQAEPWLTRDKVMIDMLKSVGIEKGKPFKPNAKTKRVLESAMREARAEIDARYQVIFDPPFYDGTHWALPAYQELMEEMPTLYAHPDRYPFDYRAVAYSMAYFSPKRLGAGQYYLMTIKDSAGQPLDGKKSYRLHVPPGVPVRLYWSATVYDRETHALIRNTSRSSRASNSAGMQKNDDGAVDVYFGPKAPANKDLNWVPTNGRDFEVLFRAYGPEKAFFDKTWRLPDIEEAK